MKKNKLILVGLAVICFHLSSYSQLSDRVNSPSTYTLGTRPVAGNYGIQIGSSYRDVEDIFDQNKDFEALPIVTLKYYNTNNTVYTIGLKTNKEKTVLKGTLSSPSEELEYKSLNSELMIVPGIEKHFGQTNILDVFVGLRAPFGIQREIEKQVSGGLTMKSSKNSLGYGIDAFVAFQAFIGDLPFAIGAEINYSLFGKLGDKYKITTEGGIGGDQTYYVTDVSNPLVSPFDEFDELSARTLMVESDIRVNLVYFFRQ